MDPLRPELLRSPRTVLLGVNPTKPIGSVGDRSEVDTVAWKVEPLGITVEWRPKVDRIDPSDRTKFA